MASEGPKKESRHMSIFSNRNSSDDHFMLFGERTSNSFVKRETRFIKLVSTSDMKITKAHQTFCTGSSYIGECHILNFCGQGTYFYPHGVVYEGRFNKDGQFHGLGTLTYPQGQKLEGVWKNGKLIEHAYVFNCGEEIDENFSYCQMPDRRFFVEGNKYFGPTGQEYLTDRQPTVELPPKCYDVVDGIYDPRSRAILSRQYSEDEEYEHPIAPQVESCLRKRTDEFMINGRMLLEIPSDDKVKWIKAECRKAWDENSGYRPDLYENWSAGRKKDLKFSYIRNRPASSENEVEEVPRKESQLVTFIKKVKKPVIDRFSLFGNKSIGVSFG